MATRENVGSDGPRMTVPPPRPSAAIGVTYEEALNMVRVAQDAGLTANTGRYRGELRARAFTGTTFAWVDDPEDVAFVVVDRDRGSVVDEYRDAA
jgi:hypothetical protein